MTRISLKFCAWIIQTALPQVQQYTMGVGQVLQWAAVMQAGLPREKKITLEFYSELKL